MVPAPVRPRAARPQLGESEGPRGVRGRAPVLARPGCRRHPHRLGRAADEGPRARRLRPRRPAVPAPLHRSGRATRVVPDVAGDRRQLSGAARADRRALAAQRRTVRRVHASGRAAHRVQLRLPRLRVGGVRAAAGHRRDPRRTRTRRRARPPGYCPITTFRGMSPATAAPTRRSASTTDSSARPPTGRSAFAGPAPPCCSVWPCPGRSTSTRARNWAWRRWRTSPTRCARTRCSSAPTGRTSAGTAAACRFRGRAPSHRSASARPVRGASRGYPSRPGGVTAPSRRRSATPVPCWSCTAARWPIGGGNRRLATARSGGCPHPGRSSRSAGGPRAAFACVVNLSERGIELPVAGTVVLSSGALDGRLLPPDTAAWVVSEQPSTKD